MLFTWPAAPIITGGFGVKEGTSPSAALAELKVIFNAISVKKSPNCWRENVTNPPSYPPPDYGTNL